MEKLLFKLDKFEGPLDLLLVLIKKNKVNIYDIPINTILQQYLEVIADMQELDLEVSSEFLVLASTLLHIKSKMLIPKHEKESEEDDPRQDLVEKLLEYKKYKRIAKLLSEIENAGYKSITKEPEKLDIPKKTEYTLQGIGINELYKAYKSAFSKLERRLPPPKRSFEGIVGHEKVSVRMKVRNIWKNISSNGYLSFNNLFTEVSSRAEAIAAFLAILELIKMEKILAKSENTENPEDIMLYPTDNTDAFNLEDIED